MNYRPISDTINLSEDGKDALSDLMIMGRSKTKYYGAYPAGFLERARIILVAGDQNASILHIPGGKAEEYNGKKGGILLSGFGPNDITVDLDSRCNPDILCDVRNILDSIFIEDKNFFAYDHAKDGSIHRTFTRPQAAIIDRPYTWSDAEQYAPGSGVFPNLNKLLRDTLEIVTPGGLVGVLDYAWPSPGEGYKEVGVYTVTTGRGNKFRGFTVWRKL